MGPYSITQMLPERGRVCVICLVNRGPRTSRLAIGGAARYTPDHAILKSGEGCHVNRQRGTWPRPGLPASHVRPGSPPRGRAAEAPRLAGGTERPVAGWEAGDTAFIICCQGTPEESLSFCLLLVNVGINNHPGIRGEWPSWNVLSF